MEQINTFTSNIDDIRDALKGFYGIKIGNNYKISYLGTIIIAEGNINLIKKNCEKDVYEWKLIGNNIYLGFIK